MIAKFFDVPGFKTVEGVTSAKTLTELHLFDTCQILSYRYVKRWTKPGDFTLVLPFDNDILRTVRINGVICVDDEEARDASDWLWIQNVSYDGDKLTLTGKDLKGWLEQRIALYNDDDEQEQGTAGYDEWEGSTKECINHYLDNNLIDPEDELRKIPLSWEGFNTDPEGSVEDHFMARFETISDIVNDLCDGAGIGYDISGSFSHGFVFHTLAGTARGEAQSVNPRVIFSLHWRNAAALSFEHGVGDFVNVIHSTGADGTTSVISRSDPAASGLSRRECHVEVSVSLDDVGGDWFNRYTLEQVKDNLETHSYTIEPTSGGYGTEYFLGDTVTVRDDYTGDLYDAVITEAEKTRSSGEKKTVITLGQQKQKPLQKIVNDLLSGTARRR